MLTGKRAIRVGEQMQKVIANVLLEKVRDPRIKNITITGVRVSNDLKLARIYFSFFGETQGLKKIENGLESAKGFIKREVGLRLEMKYVPEIIFKHDNSLESANHMDKIIEGLVIHDSKK